MGGHFTLKGMFLCVMEMLKLQDVMNKKVDPEWWTKGRDWLRASIVEGGEFIEHSAFKWWKKQEFNLKECQMEVVDIWHFMLSWLITVAIYRGYDLEVIAAHLSRLSIDDGELRIDVSNLDDEEKARRLMEFFMYRVLQRKINDENSFADSDGLNDFDDILIAFKELMIAVKMDWLSLYKMYIGKNTLNMFRQDAGYKEGTYVKIWNGEEDNVHLNKILDSFSDQELLDGNFAKRVRAALEHRYHEMVTAP